ncbi:glycosyltransferase family 2 protein [Leptospira langatensis]|uniref:Glycosyltransferase family 2 protein n=1 Tax=Leptospira langatensis TaxID=2484983 RepID=A0A5F1ZQT8_9LEPT|nr:glycosyltransferase family 2 protein [Leptospira langatensis]TGK05256.1 glycosyltransferase family 2 protein [Leptospira langatensis]TGL38392.1 glycosyltransferase family 2 protein [Leptospira langatensis]
MRPKISVLLPTFNEAENIERCISGVIQIFKNIEYEIIVIDDNSPDGTWAIVEKMHESNSRVKIIRRMTEKGLSSAIVSGMSIAEGEYFLVMDADLQHDETVLPQMIQKLEEGCDVAVGTRYANGGSTGSWNLIRKLLSIAANKFTQFILPIRITDPMSGFFALKREIFFRTGDRINPRGFKILLEILGRAGNGIKIGEIPFHFKNRLHGETKINNSIARSFLITVLDLRFGKWISSTFLLYSLVGLSGVIVNLFGFVLFESIGVKDLATGFELLPIFPSSVFFGIELSIISNFILNNYFTFYENRYKRWDAIRGFLIFSGVSALGIFVQLGIFELLFYKALPRMGMEPRFELRLFCDLVAISVAMFTNYFLNSNFTWLNAAKGQQ